MKWTLYIMLVPLSYRHDLRPCTTCVDEPPELGAGPRGLAEGR
jgi:hypothetical protein